MVGAASAMKLTTYLNYSCIFLLYLTTCSQLITAQGGRRSPCRKLNLDKFSIFSAKSSRNATIMDILQTHNETLSVEFSWNLSTGSCQASIMRSSASGSHMWNSSAVSPISSTLRVHFDQNGSSLVLRDGNSALWASHSPGTQLAAELFEDGKLLLQKSKAHICKALQMQARRASRSKQLFHSRKAKLLQESDPIAVNEDGSFISSDVYPASNESGSSNLASENSGSISNSGNGGHRNKKLLAMEIVFPVAGFLLLLALCSAVICGRKSSKGKVSTIMRSTANSSAVQKSLAREQDDEVLLENLAPLGLPPRFTYAEMDDATNGFAKKLGEGGYGAVFEGMFRTSGTRIAVKVFLNTASLACRNGFCKEVVSIGEKKHRNLVQLRGFCVEDEHRMLVYELMENGSLNKVLFGAKASERRTLQWDRRRAIAVDTAKALAFLHEEGQQKRALIHCDVKPENILLNENWVAKVSDFGLAKLLWGAANNQLHHEGDHHGDSDGGRQSPSAHDGSSTWDTGCLSGLVSSKGIRGTLGYLAPEWVRVDVGPDAITTASDVYSFGVVLLELIAGRRSMVPGHPFLLGQAFDILANGEDFSNLLDPQLLEGSPLGISFEDLEDARNFVKLALWCLQEDVTLRPTMSSIVTMLTNKESVSPPPFCDYFAGSTHFFDEVDYPLQENIFSSDTSNSQNKTSSSQSYDQGSWPTSILSAR